MQWRFLDRVLHWEKWASLSGMKAISFEEYSLLKPFGRKGFVPETFMIETCVAAARWLVIRSSEFESNAIVTSLESFEVFRAVGMGDVLRVKVDVVEETGDTLVVTGAVHVQEALVASGTLTLSMVRLAPLCPQHQVKIAWESLRAAA